MLTIQKEQMAVFSDQMREDFIKRTLQNLAQLFPDDPSVKNEPAMRALIEDGIRRAEAHGITRLREVSLFVFLVKDLGADFEKRPENQWIDEILLGSVPRGRIRDARDGRSVLQHGGSYRFKRTHSTGNVSGISGGRRHGFRTLSGDCWRSLT
jgi:hypothetical protein